MAKRAPSRKGGRKQAKAEGVRKTVRKTKRTADDRAPSNGRRKTAADEKAEDFVRGLVARGEAAKADRHGRLPPGATHEIVGETEDGLPKLRRRRFSVT